MHTFSAGDVLQFAIRIEENGESFYRKAAAASDDKAVGDLFSQLADEEIKHKKIFEDLFSQTKSVEPAESYPGEYLAYLKDYIDGRIVFSADLKSELSEVQGMAGALDFAIQREFDSILYYHELRVFIPPKDSGFLDAIIAEERKHFSTLSEAKKKLNFRT
ncbi:MAG: Rubrerythrin [Syntrophorhabdus sp. PtaU1.Bin153]|nr:MAG: Rubrerythrin [Syntrophorhabdus sp. PtaU1.Bin153]